jgi:hypothetical protein
MTPTLSDNSVMLWIWETLRRADGPEMLKEMAWTTFDDFIQKCQACAEDGN